MSTARPRSAPPRVRLQAGVPGATGELASQGFVHLVVILMTLAWLLPTLGLLVSSLRPAPDVAGTGWWTVFANPFEHTRWTLANYEHVLRQQGLARAFLNSFVIAVPGTVLPILLGSFAAFAFAWLEFPGRQVLFLCVVALIVVPLQMTFVPILRAYGQMKLAGSFLGIWLVHTGYGLPFAVYVMRNFFGSLPGELFESACIDGASPLSAFFRLALPMSTPALASLGIFQFLWVWNDLLVALIYLGGGAATGPLTLKLSSLVGSYGQQWHVLTAAAFVSMAVPVAVFFALQRYFVRGLLAGAVKG